MLKPIEPAVNLYGAQLQASKDLASAIFTSAQRVDRLMLQAANDALREQLTYAQALTAAKDFRDASVLRGAFPQPNQARALDFYQDLMKEMASTYAAMTHVAQSYMKDFGTNASDAVQSAEAMPEAAAALPTNQMFEFWNDGWRQWSAFAEQCMRGARAGSDTVVAPAPAERPARGAVKGAGSRSRSATTA